MTGRPEPHSNADMDHLLEPAILSSAETKQVSGGGANVRHGNPGGGPASYNTPGNPDYGQTREAVRAD